ncbi:MAG: hypothetical protein VKL60_15170 [Sphaerospermopsis sp.]|nr:hypothetical protein [Sphaerospermopsis sp.]
MYETFIDLDELIVRCRDKQAKKFIQEAVACYRAGAFRSCIVSTWNAVVFDFLHKLRELALLGNGDASSLLTQFENISSASKVKELWQFESSIPNWALSKFELLSPVEKSDIERLFEDRSRCAHPSMTSLEEPFEATAELARYHLRSSVMHLLQRPPVQGRSARERIFQDIKSDYFPKDPELAKLHFQTSPLARARFSLIKDIILGLTVSLLTEDLPEDERLRQFSALIAIHSIYPKDTVEILNTNLSNIIINKVTDDNWDKVIIYLSNFAGWEKLSQECQIKARTFLEELNIFDTKQSRFSKVLSNHNVNILVQSSGIDFLKEYVISKLRQIDIKYLLSLKEMCTNKTFNENFINMILKEVVPQAKFSELIEMIVDADNILKDLIKPRLQEQVQEVSLKRLISKISAYEDEYLHSLIEPYIKEKIKDVDLDELLDARSMYQSISVRKEELIEMFDLQIIKLIQEVEFDEILAQSDHWNMLPADVLQNILKSNIQLIVDKFIQSRSYVSAADNAILIKKITEYLSPAQWESILEAFCTNDQIYVSWQCPGIFYDILQESVKISGNLQPYWLTFRRNIDKFTHKDFNKIKNYIDSYRKENF